MSPTPKPANNLKHGFRTSTVLLPGDDPAEYHALHKSLTRHFRPTDLTEDRLVREMADSEWRLRRVRQMIESALTRHMATIAAADPTLTGIDLQSRAVESLAETGCSYSTWLRYESRFENQYERAYRTWTRYQEQRSRTAAKETNRAIEDAIFGPMPGQLIPPKPGHQVEPVVPTPRPASGSNVQSISDQELSAVAIQPQIARNAPCPCQSGEKYKRCCGRNAPAVLNTPIAAAA